MSRPNYSSVPTRVRNSELPEIISQTELRRLDQIGTIVEVGQGDEIISRGTPGHEWFVVVDGEFKVDGPDLHTSVGSGEVLGELAVLTGETRTASVVAATDASVYAFHRREFAALVDQTPQFCSRVVETATARLGSPLSTARMGHAAKPWSQRLAAAPKWRPVC